MFTLDLNWKQFNVSLSKLREHVDANVSTPCVGISANSKLQIHFADQPSELDQNALLSYWESIDEESDEATTYKSSEDLAQEMQTKKESAKAKLLVLGLTEAEIQALIGS